jgi:serine/tyrosine/threonine adenylyltransferase
VVARPEACFNRLMAVMASSRFVNDLPGDSSALNEPRQVHGALWSKVAPTPVPEPTLLSWSPEVAQLLGLSAAQVLELMPVLAGNAQLPGATPFAANYGGHQFGNWAGQLGDGRAIGIGELNGFELQLKGAGPTPYSRRGDGRAVLRSSLREYLCSEAMHHLGVPTTRALSLVSTGERVVRDLFYDGHPEEEPGAIVCRVAPTFLRFGNFELCASRGDTGLLTALLDFTLAHYFPELPARGYAALLHEVAQRTAKLMAAWQAVGFVHGVMNTDNMSILGLTIDYGPYGWVDDFNPGWTPNTTDRHQRRYRYGNQPEVGLWNVERLGVAMLPALGGDEAAVIAALDTYERVFHAELARRFTEKLGLPLSGAQVANQLFSWLAKEETDFTLFFRGLSRVLPQPEPTAFPGELREAFYGEPSAAHLEAGLAWVRTWWKAAREGGEPAEVARAMNAVNPKYVLRNWLAQQAIDAAHAGELSELELLFDVLRRPFDEQPGRERFAAKRPEWARNKPGCSALSCSS